MERELAALGAMKCGGHRDLDAELVGCVRLALADAFHFRCVEAVDLLASLVLPLLDHPRGQMQWLPEDVTELVVAGDPPADVADGAAEIGLERAQTAPGPLKLLGMGISLVLDQGELAHPRIGLAEIEPRLLRQADQLLAGPVHELGV